MIWCGFKNAYHKGIVWFKEFGLRAQNVITIIDSRINIIGGAGHKNDQVTSASVFTLIMLKIFI